MRTRMWALTALSLCVGCAHKKAAAPPSSSIDFAGKHATFRDWRGQDACKADAMTHWSELEAMSALLTEYLAQTAEPPDSPKWTNDQVAMLDASQKDLPPMLDALDSQTNAVGKCKFPKSSGVEDSAKHADELSQQARKRVADAATIVPKLKGNLEVMKWKAAQDEAIKSGKESWCGGKPPPGRVPDIFYAAVDETGKAEWLFCDDVKVVASADGGKPEVQLEDPKKKKPSNAKAYVEAALKYPPSEVQHAPVAGAEKKEEKPAEQKPAEGSGT